MQRDHGQHLEPKFRLQFEDNYNENLAFADQMLSMVREVLTARNPENVGDAYRGGPTRVLRWANPPPRLFLYFNILDERDQIVEQNRRVEFVGILGPGNWFLMNL